MRDLMAGKDPYADFLPLTQKGDSSSLQEVEAFMAQHASCSHLADDATKVLAHIVTNPKSFAEPQKIADIMLGRGISATTFFAKAAQHGVDEARIWVMPALDPRPETQATCIHLAAEFMRAHLGASNAPYAFPVEAVFAHAKTQLGTAFDKESFVATLTQTQNKLVEAVRGSSQSGPINRAEAILDMLGDEDGNGHGFWTEKLSGVKIRNVYSDTRGDITSYRLVFQEPV